MKHIIVFLAVVLFFNACTSTNNPSLQNEKNSSSHSSSIAQGDVIGFIEDKVIIKANIPYSNSNSSYQINLANKIIKNSVFIAGMQTYVDNKKAYINDVRANELILKTENSKLQVGQKVNIYIPKKTIAIMDFSLISVNNEAEKFQLEDMNTQIVKSGQYKVVEREKLDLILEEQKLADSGLLDANAASKIGKLVSADILLSGTFTEQGDVWSINIKLIDVATGIILVATNEKIALHEFKPKNPKNSQDRRPPPKDDGERPPQRF